VNDLMSYLVTCSISERISVLN